MLERNIVVAKRTG